jgi:hypothetical protein
VKPIAGPEPRDGIRYGGSVSVALAVSWAGFLVPPAGHIAGLPSVLTVLVVLVVFVFVTGRNDFGDCV